MRFLTTILLIFFTPSAFACASGDWEDHYFFYSIFHQSNIASTDYCSFLRVDNSLFSDCEDDPSYSWQPANCQLWTEILPTWTVQEIDQILTIGSNESFEQLWDGKNSGLEPQAKRYMQYARKCSDAFQYRSNYSWDYDQILQNSAPDVTPLLSEGIPLFQAAKDPQIKVRYAYQIVRTFHYSKQYQEAIDFFENNSLAKENKDEIYYYLIDQLAGCYYSLEQYEQAALRFIRVFSNSRDRKESAYLSYRFCKQVDLDFLEYLETPADKIGYTTINSLSEFEDKDDVQPIRDIAAIDANDETVELLFARALNDLEREALPTEIGMQDIQDILAWSTKNSGIRDMTVLADELKNNPIVKNKEYWQLASSYLSFLNNDLPLAKEKLAAIQTTNLKEQKKILNYIYEVFGWDKITPNNELFLAAILDDIIKPNGDDYSDFLPPWKHFILDRAGHLYYKNGELAKAFMAHNSLSAILRISSLPLIDELLAFVDQPEKNKMERILLRRIENQGTYTKDYLRYIKGLHYLEHAQPKEALKYLTNSPLMQTSTESYGLGTPTTARIFSNNTVECFGCPKEDIMNDSVYLAPLFSFIKPSFNTAELTTYLIQLDSITKDPKEWKRKLAHYLLGNYYFNVSNTGYYRGALYGWSNCCSYNYHRSSGYSVAQKLEDKHGYNLYGISEHYSSFNNFQLHAMMNYKQTLEYSTDKELNARTLYMMAKCELNKGYNSKPKRNQKYFLGDGGFSSETNEYKDSFRQLKDNYQDTEFYNQILQECSFFRYYCSF